MCSSSNRLATPIAKQHPYKLVTSTLRVNRAIVVSTNVNQPSIMPLKSWYPPHCADVLYTRHATLPLPDIHFNVECTIRFDANFSGHIWISMYMKRSTSALGVREAAADLNAKNIFNSSRTQNRSTSFPCTFSDNCQKQHKKNQYVVVVTERYSKHTRAIQTSKTSTTHMANGFLKHWIISFSFPSHFLTNIGPQFVCNVLVSICRYLGVQTL